MKIVGNQVHVDPPKKPKKLTGTRFASIFGLNRWNTAFKTWCEVTRTYEEPFEDTIYTIAGKAIEPKQAQFMKVMYGMGNIVTPQDVYGPDPFKKTYGDFFRDWDVFGGMWDYLLKDPDGNVEAVLEMKTTKRSEDWAEDVPEYYAMQAALYAYLLGVDQVYMVCTFLEDKDYENPDDFKVTIDNTLVRPFKVSERYPQFTTLIREAMQWWEDHVVTGVSPDFDPKADAEIIKALTKHTVTGDCGLDEIIREAEVLQAKLDKVSAETAADEKRLKELKGLIKEELLKSFGESDKKVEVAGNAYTFTVTKSVTTKADTDRLKAEGMTDYLKTTVESKLTIKGKKE